MPTQYRGYPLVAAGDAPDGRTQINALATALDADINRLAQGLRQGAKIYYTSSDTFSKGNYPGLKAIDVEVIGAGGGSGYADDTDSTHVSAGAGGAGGGYCLARLSEGDLLSSETVIVGPGGAGGTAGSPSGGDGEESSFGSHCGSPGGFGGTSSSADYTSGGLSMVRGAGGVPWGTYQLAVAGEGYGGITTMPNSVVPAVAGLLDHLGLHGGAAGGPWGQANVPANAITDMVSTVAVVAAAGVGPGSGASGPFNPPSGSGADGAAGAAGLVIVTVYY